MMLHLLLIVGTTGRRELGRAADGYFAVGRPRFT
jgi:hypothetical protein